MKQVNFVELEINTPLKILTMIVITSLPVIVLASVDGRHQTWGILVVNSSSTNTLFSSMYLMMNLNLQYMNDS